MRQRSVKNLGGRIEENSRFRIKTPQDVKGSWSRVFGNENPIYLEIGCGKGKFILEKAIANPDKNFIAVEGQQNVVLRALEKAEEAELNNLRIFIGFVNDLRDYFEEGELAGIYLNFSDPWPKARHEKRRLTNRDRLTNYFQVMGEGGFVEFKTDNEGLFEFTLSEIEALERPVLELSHDLHQSCYASKDCKTEYEEKFSSQGKKIHYVKI